MLRITGSRQTISSSAITERPCWRMG